MAKAFAILATAGLLTAGGMAAAAGFESDGHGNVNYDLFGVIKFGDCVELMYLPETKDPATEHQLLETIRSIGRLCGYCYTEKQITLEAQTYKICVDPETIEINHNDGDLSTIGIVGYVGTAPEGPPGIVFSAFESDENLCATAIPKLESEMEEYFAEAFGELPSTRLSVDVKVSEFDSLPCETALPDQTVTTEVTS